MKSKTIVRRLAKEAPRLSDMVISALIEEAAKRAERKGRNSKSRASERGTKSC